MSYERQLLGSSAIAENRALLHVQVILKMIILSKTIRQSHLQAHALRIFCLY